MDTMLQLNKKRREKGFVMGAAVPGIPFTLFNESSVKTRVMKVSMHLSAISYFFVL